MTHPYAPENRDLEQTDESLQKSINVNPTDSKPWASLSALVQATCNLGSVTQCGHKSQSTCTSGQKCSREFNVSASTSGSGTPPPAKKASGDKSTNAHAYTSARFADSSVELQ